MKNPYSLILYLSCGHKTKALFVLRSKLGALVEAVIAAVGLRGAQIEFYSFRLL
jgi:hypothetical protein